MTEITREDLTTLAESDDVKMRATGVIGGWLWDNYGASDSEDGPVSAAKDLIATLNAADLLTYVGTDLHAGVEALQAEAWQRGFDAAAR